MTHYTESKRRSDKGGRRAAQMQMNVSNANAAFIHSAAALPSST
jgi:hypothetical protein